MDPINVYTKDPFYILISNHLETFEKELLSIINGHKFLDEKNSERLIQEYLQKIYNSLYTISYALTYKDSFALNLTAKYIYEVFIDFFFIFHSKETEESLVAKFFEYELTPDKHDWIDLNRSERINKIDQEFFETHKTYYSRLNNHAHPSILSFFTSRRGLNFEKWLIFSNVLMIISTVIVIIKHEKTVQFFNVNLIEIEELLKQNLKLSKILIESNY